MMKWGNMNITIREMTRADKESVIDMMRVFYRSPAVLTDGSEEIFETDVENCLGENTYLEGYVFENEQGVQGYAMVAKSFSTEFGKPLKWIEDIYIKETLRGTGIGTKFFRYIEEKYPDSIFKLEVETENERAVNVYKKNGYKFLNYYEMIKM